MKGIIDRFEGDFAVIETETRKTISLLKENVKNANEGDSVELEEKNAVFVVTQVLTDETEKRQARITSLMNDLFE